MSDSLSCMGTDEHNGGGDCIYSLSDLGNPDAKMENYLIKLNCSKYICYKCFQDDGKHDYLCCRNCKNLHHVPYNLYTFEVPLPKYKIKKTFDYSKRVGVQCMTLRSYSRKVEKCWEESKIFRQSICNTGFLDASMFE